MPYLVTTDRTQEGLYFAKDFLYDNGLSLTFEIEVIGDQIDLDSLLDRMNGTDSSMIILDQAGVIGRNLFETSFKNIMHVIYLTGKTDTGLPKENAQVYIREISSFGLNEVSETFTSVVRNGKYLKVRMESDRV